MRASEIRALIISTIEACTLDYKAAGADKFNVYRRALEPESVQSRTAMVKLLSPPTKDESNTCDLFTVTFQIIRFYPAGDTTEDRAADDTERLYAPLWRLHEQDADLESSELGAPSIEDVESMLIVRQDITCLYRLSADLI
jgi:hypothetical protein